MGTRGAIGFHSKGQDKVTYNHSDSYPTWLGKQVLEFIKDTNIEELRSIFNKIELVDEQAKPNAEQLIECLNYFNGNVGEQDISDWYCLLRETQGDLSPYKTDLKYMIDSAGFLEDSLFCEYAYIINVDNETLEFYSGFNKKPRARMGRYANKNSDGGEYYGVACVAKFSLDTLYNATPELINSVIEIMEEKATAFYKKQERDFNKENKVKM